MPKTVLLVDYDPKSIATIGRCLASLGVRTLLATDGYAAEREFLRTRPQLTLVQDVIPRRRGVDLCRALKSSLYEPSLPVILIADVRNGGRYQVIASGCDDLIEKPFDEATLTAKVSRFLFGDLPLASSQ